ncbi:YbaN family protein [Streptococcus dentasini]
MKFIYITLGCLAFVLGLIGVILPVLPTTPFLLLAGVCFTRSSEKFEFWLKRTRVYQNYVSDYAETKTISKERKKKIIWRIYVLMAVSIILAPLWPVRLLLAGLTIFITYYLFKVIPDKDE